MPGGLTADSISITLSKPCFTLGDALHATVTLTLSARETFSSLIFSAEQTELCLSDGQISTKNVLSICEQQVLTREMTNYDEGVHKFTLECRLVGKGLVQSWIPVLVGREHIPGATNQRSLLTVVITHKVIVRVRTGARVRAPPPGPRPVTRPWGRPDR